MRLLGGAYYTPHQLDLAIGSLFGVDTQLIDDGTYFVIDGDDRLAGAGGWSYRQTLYGASERSGRDPSPLDPATQPARIRAFYVDPDHARRGVGRALLARCEAEAEARGYRSLELLGTLGGVALYAALGYEACPVATLLLPDGTPMAFVPMRKTLAAARGRPQD